MGKSAKATILLEISGTVAPGREERWANTLKLAQRSVMRIISSAELNHTLKCLHCNSSEEVLSTHNMKGAICFCEALTALATLYFEWRGNKRHTLALTP